MGFAPASCDCLHKTGCNHHHVPKIDPFPILLQIRGAYIIRAFYGCMVTRGVLYANLTYWQDFFQLPRDDPYPDQIVSFSQFGQFLSEPINDISFGFKPFA